jgi:hypothetical protein
MGKTMTPGQALTLVGLRFKGMVPDGFGARFADEVQSKIWQRYPWRGSLM